MSSVTIIGAGWAGLAAAIELSRHNVAVTVYESAKQIGGRARDVETGNTTLDNGQHLMIGAYNQLLALLKIIGTAEYDVFHRINMQIILLDLATGNTAFELNIPSWPAPFHLLAGMLGCKPLSFTEKLKTLWLFNKILKRKLVTDISVTDWLKRSNLPDRYCEYLLKPLCLAALTTHPDQASARAFQTVLQQTFIGARTNTDLLIAKTTLSKLFPESAKLYIESHGGKILTSSKVNSIDPVKKTLTVNDNSENYKHLILATPATITLQLLQAHSPFLQSTHKLSQLQHEPICTVYLQYPAEIKLPLPMMGCIHASSEWIFDRQYCNQPGLMAVIISANGKHMHWSNDELIAKITTELAQLFPAWPAPLHTQVIRDKRAAFRCHTHVDDIRPTINTAVKSIKLCGDYIYIEDNLDAGLPATLEGAVRAGVKSAQLTLQEMQT